MKISIAIATYNGEKFIDAQLRSILEQSVLPDEIVVSDDGSGDSTMSIIASLDLPASVDLRILDNRERLGFARNFERALRACTGDVLFLCDQDDIWHRDKVERVAAALGSRLLLHTDARLVDDEGGLIAESYSRRSKKRPGYAPFARILDDNCVTGCTSAIARQLLESSPPFPEGIPHDQWLALLAADKKGLVYFPAALIDYRQHANNVKGAGKRERPAALSPGAPVAASREKHERKASVLRNLRDSMRGVVSAENDRILADIIAYHELLTGETGAWRCMLLHAKHFRHMNYRDPVGRRILKLMGTPLHFCPMRGRLP